MYAEQVKIKKNIPIWSSFFGWGITFSCYACKSESHHKVNIVRGFKIECPECKKTNVIRDEYDV